MVLHLYLQQNSRALFDGIGPHSLTLCPPSFPPVCGYVFVYEITQLILASLRGVAEGVAQG